MSDTAEFLEEVRKTAVPYQSLLQSDVLAWHKALWPDSTEEGRLAKIEEEFREFMENPSMEEAADLYLTLLAYAAHRGFSLEHAAWAKFLINRDSVYEWHNGHLKRVKLRKGAVPHAEASTR